MMYSFNSFEGPFSHCQMPHAANAQPIPPFFINFLHELHRLVNEYTAELNRWGFCAQRTQGCSTAATDGGGTQWKRSDSLSACERVGRTERQCSARCCQVRSITLNKQPQDKVQQKRTNVEGEGRAAPTTGHTSVFNASPISQKATPSRRRAAIQPPLSIRDRLRRTLAPKSLANAANEQMPLETLEQTVSETLPGSITESGNYADFLRQYLDDFERELEDDGLNIGFCAEKTNVHSNNDERTQSQIDDTTVANFVAPYDHSAASGSISINGFVPAPQDKCENVRLEDGTVQPSAPLSSPDAIKSDGRKRTNPPFLPPEPRQHRWKVLKKCENAKGSEEEQSDESISNAEKGEKDGNWKLGMPSSISVEHPTNSDTSAHFSVIRQDAVSVVGCNTPSRFRKNPSPLRLTKQCIGDRTPQKKAGFRCMPQSFSSPPRAFHSPTSTYSISSIKVLEHGRVKFKKMPSSAQKTPIKRSTNTPPLADDKLLISTPKLLSTRRVYCNFASARRPRRIAPQKEGGKCGESQKRQEEEQGEESQRHEQEGYEEEAVGVDDGMEKDNHEATPSSTPCKRGSVGEEQTATKSGVTCDAIAPATNDGRSIFSELDDELIRLVLNEFHATSSDK